MSLDAKWHDLYKIGAVSCVVVNGLVVAAIAAFFIWSYAPREIPTVEIFEMLQTDRIGALFALDILLLITTLVLILPMLALYVALKPVNESYALIALVFGLMSIVFVTFARPITELVYLSDLYADATSDIARNQYLAAGEALIMVFDGTAWMVYTVFLGISTIISGTLMLRSDVFGKTAGYVGIVVGATPMGFFIPTLGPLLLLIATFGGIVWYVMLVRVFYQLGWQQE